MDMLPTCPSAPELPPLVWNHLSSLCSGSLGADGNRRLIGGGDTYGPITGYSFPGTRNSFPILGWGDAQSLCVPWGCPTFTYKVLPLWQGEIHPEGEPLQQVKDETWLRIPLVYPYWGSSWTCPMRCSRPGKRFTRCALLLLLFLGMLQQRLWSAPTSDPGRGFLLGGPQGRRLCHGRAAGVMGGLLVSPIHTGHWH